MDFIDVLSTVVSVCPSCLSFKDTVRVRRVNRALSMANVGMPTFLTNVDRGVLVDVRLTDELKHIWYAGVEFKFFYLM